MTIRPARESATLFAPLTNNHNLTGAGENLFLPRIPPPIAASSAGTVQRSRVLRLGRSLADLRGALQDVRWKRHRTTRIGIDE